MKLRQIFFCFLFAAASSFAATTNDLPKFDEIYQLLRTNLGGVSEADLDHAAVQGLLNQLHSQTTLVTSAPAINVAADSATVSKTTIYDNSFACFRIGKVEGDVGEKFSANYRQLRATNKIKGLVLDLRFTGGTDYAAAASVADRFLNSEQPLLDWGTGSARSTTKTDAITVPVVILINSQTSGAAEALAAILRESNVGLLLGSTSAGQASIFKEFSLANGEKLRIATAQIKLGDNKVLAHGLKPDIEISASLEDEKAHLEDPYKILHKPEVAKISVTETNLASNNSTNHTRRRFNEAELVRQQREGVEPDQAEMEGKPLKDDPAHPVLADPALSRALDLLKGLSVVQQSRPG